MYILFSLRTLFFCIARDVTLSLSCLRSMEQLKACHSLEFENVTVDSAMVVLNEFIPALCGKISELFHSSMDVH